MRDRRLHDALRTFGVEAAGLLTEEVRNGEEVPFVIEERGTHPVLYRYSPLTAEFIALRWSVLHRLRSYGSAALALESRAGTYLRLRGLPGDDPEPALRDFLERLYDESTTFEFPEERFDELYAELERMLAQATLRATVIAPIHGLALRPHRMELEDGLSLLQPSELSNPPEALAASGESRQAGRDDAVLGATVMCAFETDLPSDAPLPLPEARAQFRHLLSVLRLAGAGGAAFSPIAWARAGEGAWHPTPLADSGKPGREPWRLATEEEAELRELLGVIARSRHAGTVRWALDRFEMGCARAVEAEALTDYLLGLRALLADDAGGTGVPLRVAALCAGTGERPVVQRRVELALELERSIIEAGDATDAEALVPEIEQYLRALLRDVLCGYLDADLRAAADDILLAADGQSAAGHGEIRALDTRATRPGVEADVEPDASDADTRELEAIGAERLDQPVETAVAQVERPEARETVGDLPAEAAVTPCADWGFDEDAESYSAPV